MGGLGAMVPNEMGIYQVVAEKVVEQRLMVATEVAEVLVMTLHVVRPANHCIRPHSTLAALRLAEAVVEVVLE